MVDSGSLYLKAGLAYPDQDPSLVIFLSLFDLFRLFWFLKRLLSRSDVMCRGRKRELALCILLWKAN